MMKNNSLSEVVKQLQAARNIAVVCHVRPDGDALGSGLALTLALKNAGKNVYMLCDDQPPERLCIFNTISGVMQKLPIDKDELDAFVSVDSADLSRIGSFATPYSKFKGVTVNIDHHISNDKYGKINYVIDCPATCEIIPEILEAAGYEITTDIANLLALGLLTDSGNFAHQDVSSKTFNVAAKLKEKGADLSYIAYEMFSKQTKQRAILYGRVMNKMRFALNDRLVFITVTQKDFEETQTDKSQTEGFVDFPLSIEGVEVAAAVMEVKQGQYKVSLRSKRANVNAIAASFGGGGHVLASGCMLFGEYEEVIEKLTYAVYQNL
jgi:phosphoesterase RecJ-like protein